MNINSPERKIDPDESWEGQQLLREQKLLGEVAAALAPFVGV